MKHRVATTEPIQPTPTWLIDNRERQVATPRAKRTNINLVDELWIITFS